MSSVQARRSNAVFLACALLMPAVALAPSPVEADEGATVNIRIAGLESSKGTVLCTLFKGGEGFPSAHTKAFKRTETRISGGKASLSFKGLPPGEYAVAAFHDENGNKKLDTGMFGAPTEGWGVSNNPPRKLRAPRYSEAKFTVSADATKSLNVKLRYPNW